MKKIKLTIKNLKTGNIMEAIEEWTSTKNGKQYYSGLVYGQIKPANWKKENCIMWRGNV